MSSQPAAASRWRRQLRRVHDERAPGPTGGQGRWKPKTLFPGRSRPMNPTPRLPRLTLNRLEDRTLPATGITAALAGGVLRVTGTAANDTILIKQTAANAA